MYYNNVNEAGLDDDDDDPTIAGSGAALAAAQGKKGNVLNIHGNVNTMNINPLIHTNIVGSPYFKVNLYEMKTYHEVVDEIYYRVDHLEPWERGSRSTGGQTGMCGGVRGVGAGGIVSSAYCLLFKLGTLKLTRKQVNGLINHGDSPYIRGLGFMYIRYTQPASDFWTWFYDYLEDPEEIDVKAGGGKVMTIGQLVRSFMEKLEWFDTRFPRIPVNVQKEINDQLAELYPTRGRSVTENRPVETAKAPSRQRSRSRSGSRSRSKSKSKKHKRSRSRDRERSKRRSRSRSRDRRRSRSRSRSRDRKKSKHKRRSRSRSRSRDRGKDKHRDKDRKKHRKHDRDGSSYADELKKYSEYRNKHKKHKRSRSRSR